MSTVVVLIKGHTTLPTFVVEGSPNVGRKIFERKDVTVPFENVFWELVQCVEEFLRQRKVNPILRSRTESSEKSLTDVVKRM